MLKKIVITAILALAVMALFFTLPCGMSLIIKDNAGHAYVERSVASGDVVSLEFTHSVQKVQVVDTFLVSGDGALLLTNTTYGALGAGLPSDASYNITVEDGNFTIKNINTTFNGIHMMTGALTRNYLTVSGEIIPIYAILPDSKPLFLYIEHNTPAIMVFNRIRTYF